MKIFRYSIFMIIPAIYCYLSMYVMDNLTEITEFLFGVIFARQTGTVLFMFYAFSLLYVILYVKYKFASMWILPVSFLITPMSAYI